MAVIKRDPEDVEQLEIRLPVQPDGANTLIIVTGRIATGELEFGQGARSGTSPQNTYLVHAGPELAPEAIRSVRATATVTSVYAGSFPMGSSPDPNDFKWTLGDVDAVHDDDVRKARISVIASVFARNGGFVRIEQLGFELRIMARR
jgi:hypothetical protein